MRIMWIASSIDENSHNYAAQLMKSRGIKFVERMMHRHDLGVGHSNDSIGCVRVFITSEADFEGMTGFRSKNRAHWKITSCNKQYVSVVFPNHYPTTKYLGSMCKVDVAEAFAHIKINNSNWYILDVETNVRWIACNRNPTTRIVDDMPLFPKQTREWPLKGITYEDWKRGIVKKMVATLEEAL